MEIDDDGEVDFDAIPLPPPPDPSTDDNNAAGGRSTNRPGQAGFAQRLMAKYGWTKGSGLGADEGGITSALRVQMERRRRRADAEGGGWAEPGGKGRIIGGKQADASGSGKKRGKHAADEEEKEDEGDGEGFGRMSTVVVLRNMLEGMPDLAAEVEAGLGQEIGEECGEKYGRVERLFIDVQGRRVFIKFTDQVSALRVGSAKDLSILSPLTLANTARKLGRLSTRSRVASSTAMPSCPSSTTKTSSRPGCTCDRMARAVSTFRWW